MSITKTAGPTYAELEQLYCSSEQDFASRDHRLCDCPMTYVHRKRHPALGRGIEIRLCCLAKKVEELAGLSPGTFFLSLEFEPSWDWDCDKEVVQHQRLPDGSIQEVYGRLGAPPRWLRERMEKKGLTIHNL